MNRPEQEAYTLDALEPLDFIMGGGLQGLPELLVRNNLNMSRNDPVANSNYPRQRVESGGSFRWLRRLLCDLPHSS
jgi:hypothetical protein